MKVGITLLYSILEKGRNIGVLKSYVIDCLDKYSVIQEAEKKAKQQVDLRHPNYKFLGIEDVFTVTGEVREGELMGRTTLYDIDSVEVAKKMVMNDSDFAKKSEYSSNNFCGSLIYFYEGDKEKYAFTIYAITIGAINEVVKNLKDIATSGQFIKKIIDTSVESMEITKVSFLGIENINAITEDVTKGGSYLVHYNDEVENEEELLSMLPSGKELTEMINDVYVMPSSVS